MGSSTSWTISLSNPFGTAFGSYFPLQRLKRIFLARLMPLLCSPLLLKPIIGSSGLMFFPVIIRDVLTWPMAAIIMSKPLPSDKPFMISATSPISPLVTGHSASAAPLAMPFSHSPTRTGLLVWAWMLSAMASGVAPERITSFTAIATASMPMASYFSANCASRTLVPTPSMARSK